MSATDEPQMLEQKCVVYRPPAKRGEITPGEVVYSTAYTDEDVRNQIANCAIRHGREARVRAVEARTIKATWEC